jgi:hypothetical protein
MIVSHTARRSSAVHDYPAEMPGKNDEKEETTMRNEEVNPIRRSGMAIIAASLMLLVGAPAFAQSTLGDPVPIGDPAGSSIARTAAINGTIAPQGKPSVAELARRRAHGDQLSACNTRARNGNKAGSSGRKAARAKCQATFKAQKATWYDKRYQRK